MLFGHIDRDVQCKAGFAHAGAGGQNNQVAAPKAGEHFVKVSKPGGDAKVLFSVRAGYFLQGVISVDDRAGNRLHRALVAPGTDFVDLLLRTFQ
ncbi:hypothetical protein SDC9_145189 [bioreactor metagenome]|uniref:Uncharacterized protein n=1 Tax=bioreactor metagenome TaxID=1076179 RepID=A0A645EA46_9ZZZZ